MKKLRFFDSLKFVRAMFVVVACIFAFAPAHADNTWKYTPIPIRYYANDSLVELTESDENFNTYTVKTTTTTSNRLLYVRTENSLPANHKYFFNFRFKSNFTHRPYFRYSFDGGTTYTNLGYDNNCQPNTWCNLSAIITPQQDWSFTGVVNGIVLQSSSYIAGETITIDKNGFLTVFDLTEIFGAGNEPATAADAERALSIDTTIKIATTKYNEESFAPVKTDLSAAVNAVEYVVSNTMSQAQAIDQIANEKQTRPDEGCDAKYCLLVEGEDGTPHWYPIAGANGVAHNLPAGYTELQYLQSDGSSWIIVPYRVNNKTVFYARYNEIQNGPQTASVVFGVTSTPAASSANYGILRLINGTSSANLNRMGWGSSTNGSVINVNAPQNLNTWYEVLYDQNKLYQDNVLYATSPTSNDTEWVANYDLGIFARNSATVTMPAIAKISSVWAKEDGEYKINLVPAKNSSGVVGLYDMVSGQFFTNAGTGTFTAGPDM